MEYLKVENFGGIKNMNLPIKKVNIIIGPQGAGKSLCLKLIYFFKHNISHVIVQVLTEGTVRIPIKELMKREFMRIFPPFTWPNLPFTVEYGIENSYIKVIANNKDNDFEILFSENLLEFLDLYDRFFINNVNPTIREIKQLIVNLNDYKTKNLPKSLTRANVFLPAGRLFFSVLKNNYFDIPVEVRMVLDEFIENFGYEINYKQDFWSTKLESKDNEEIKKTNDLFKSYIKKITNGKLERIEDSQKDILTYNDGREVDIFYSSTGAQELIPLMDILKIEYWNESKSPKSLFIEEPEAHLYPTSQKLIVQTIAGTINKLESGSFFITTHSPYILASFNNLLKAGSLSKKKPSLSSKINKIVKPEEQLNSNDFAVHSIEKSGIKNIFDHKLGLIKPNILDEIANQINKEFTKLLDLEYEDQ